MGYTCWEMPYYGVLNKHVDRSFQIMSDVTGADRRQEASEGRLQADGGTQLEETQERKCKDRVGDDLGIAEDKKEEQLGGGRGHPDTPGLPCTRGLWSLSLTGWKASSGVQGGRQCGSS